MRQIVVRMAENYTVKVRSSSSPVRDIVALHILPRNSIEESSMNIKTTNNSILENSSSIGPFTNNNALDGVGIGKRYLSDSPTRESGFQPYEC